MDPTDELLAQTVATMKQLADCPHANAWLWIAATAALLAFALGRRCARPRSPRNALLSPRMERGIRTARSRPRSMNEYGDLID